MRERNVGSVVLVDPLGQPGRVPHRPRPHGQRARRRAATAASRPAATPRGRSSPPRPTWTSATRPRSWPSTASAGCRSSTAAGCSGSSPSTTSPSAPATSISRARSWPTSPGRRCPGSTSTIAAAEGWRRRDLPGGGRVTHGLQTGSVRLRGQRPRAGRVLAPRRG